MNANCAIAQSRLNISFRTLSILYIKAMLGRFFQSLPIPCGVGDKQGKAGRPGQPLRGAARGAISIKEILGENRGTYI